MEQTFSQGNQVMLFLNRRGYAPQLQCYDCGYQFLCPSCDRPFTYHKSKHSLHCHHCQIVEPVPEHCPNCNSSNLNPLGAGTEKIAEISASFYNANKVIRIDRDTTKNINDLEQNLQLVHDTPGALLIGTQMLAKGHHFPDVTLVALLNVDALLKGTDFRAAERLAQLYVQVAGRAGREEKKGTVVLQTSYPDDPTYHDLLTMSYYDFALKYLLVRKQYYLPPFSCQGYIGIRHQDVKVIQAGIILIKAILEKYINQWLNMQSQAQVSSRLNPSASFPGYSNPQIPLNNNIPLEPELYYHIDYYDQGKQNDKHRYIIDFIAGTRTFRNYVLGNFVEDFQQSNLFKNKKLSFYLDIDPIDQY